MYDVICIGGGLAGLTAAIHLSKEGRKVLVLEKEKYPHHKVCGEYLSLEVVPYLTRLGIDLPSDIIIDTLEFSTQNGRSLQIDLPLGAVGISRYTLDYTLYRVAESLGADFEFCNVNSVAFDEQTFTVTSNTSDNFCSKYVLGTYGKRSQLDKSLKRNFIKKKSPWLAVKAHYDCPDFPDHLVGLHSFKGGYAGLSKTESDAVNFCYLVNYESFQQFRDVEQFNASVVAQNPYLANFLKESTALFEKPLTIAQVSFEYKSPVEDHMLMCGDSAGLIHPLCGNGMAMAIHSAKIASELIHDQLKKNKPDRYRLEKEYSRVWRRTFGKRIRTGRLLQRLLLSPGFTNILFSLASRSPIVLRGIIRKTHGKPIEI